MSRIKWFVCFNSDFLRVLRNHWAGVEPLSSAEVYNSCYFSPLPSRQEQCPVSVLSVQWLSSGQMLQIFSSKLEIPPHRKADCACGKGIQLDPTVEIKEWEGPLLTAAAFLSAFLTRAAPVNTEIHICEHWGDLYLSQSKPKCWKMVYGKNPNVALWRTPPLCSKGFWC